MQKRTGTTKLLSWVLAILLLVGLVPPAFAEDAESDLVIDEEGTLTEYIGSGGEVVIPEGVVKIGEAAFKDCTELTQITISPGVEIIRDRAFQGCTGLTEISLPTGLTWICEDAFRGCSGLAQITLPADLESIGESAFQDCTSLTSVTIPESVSYIWEKAFAGCTKLTSVKIPADIWELKPNAFDGTPWLKQINSKAPDFTVINGVLFEYTGSGGKISIPDSVSRIYEDAFWGCEELTEVIIPDSVQVIGKEAFRNCENLKSVVIGSGVQLIADYAFYDCPSLKKISLPEDVSGIQVTKNAFVVDHVLDRATRQKLYEILQGQWVDHCLEPQSEVMIELSGQIAGRGTDYEKAKAICNWVSNNIKYDYDYYYDRKKDVDLDLESILESRTTICAGYTELANALLQAQGIPALRVTGLAGAENASDWEGHAWSEAYVDGRWIMIDTTWGTEYFDMKLSDFIRTHQGEERDGVHDTEDVPSDWAKEEVWEAMMEGLIPVDLQKDYQLLIDRREMCELLVSLVECASGKSIDAYLRDNGMKLHESFTDTENEAILAAAALGFASGRGNGGFDPSAFVTRQEAAAMLARAAKELGLAADGTGETFSDAETISSWAADSVTFVTGLEDPVSGVPVMDGLDGYFYPGAYCDPEIAMVAALRILHCVEAAREGAEQAA